MSHLDLTCTRQDKDQTIAAVLKNRLGLSWTRIRSMITGRFVRIGGQVESDPTRRCRPGLRVSIATHVLDTKLVEDIRAREARYTRQPKPKVKPELDLNKTDKKKAKLKPPGAKVESDAPVEKTKKEKPSKLPMPEIDIIYADDEIVIANKPVGLTTVRHKDEADEFGDGQRFLPKTLLDLLPALLGTPRQRLIAVHRIDRDTSGLVAVARTRSAAKSLMDQFKVHAPDREYLAIVRGHPTSNRIQSTLVRDRGDGRRGSGEGADAKQATTHVRVTERMGDFAVVACKLETGRTHQVRIHLGEAGFPLCGEKVYDRPMNGKPIPDRSGARRPMLHAASLGLVHPETGETMNWSVPPPADFAKLWAELRTAKS